MNAPHAVAAESKPKAPPEESPVARAAVLGAMLVAVLGLAVTASLPLAAIFTAAGVAAGHRVSWTGRHRKRSAAGQMVLGLALSAAVVYLFLDLFGGAFGGNLPQAHFALAAAVITAFDLKTRRNLYSHLWHSLVILYIAGLFAWSSVFVVAVVAWGACMLAFFAATRRGAPSRRRPARWGRLSAVGALWLAASIAVFIAMPELPGRPLATSVLVSVPNLHARGEALPAALPVIGSQSGQAGIDLRARGRLGDEVAFHVRANGGGYWRAYSLPVYTGQDWERGSSDPVPIEGIGGSVPSDDAVASTGSPTLSQTFFMESDLPTELIGAYPIVQTYYPAPQLRALSDGTVEAPAPLTAGSSYSVVSAVRDLSPERLRAAGVPQPGDVPEEDLALPAGVTERTRGLAAQVMQGATEYDRVSALQQYLSTHYPYSLDTPRLAPGNDAVDQFLFIDRVGFCEQFASAMTVMLRTQGIPARVAIGYASTERDALTGTYTVRNRDAHAWTEVFFAGTGWVPFDATPGFDATPASSTSPTSFLSIDSLVKLGGVPGGAQAVGIVVVLIIAIVLIIAAGRRWRRRAAMHPLLRRYSTEMRRLRRRRLPGRDPTETVEEHIERLGSVAPDEAARLQPLATAVEAHLYEVQRL